MSVFRVGDILWANSIQMEKDNEDKKDFRYIVRIGGMDLDGNKPLYLALTKVKGVGFVLANAILNVLDIEKDKKVGYLSDAEISKLNNAVENPIENNIPSWLVNRRKDIETGKDMHLIGGNLSYVKDNDIKRMKNIRCYKGIRHAFGLPVRGQRTKSNFRKNKGKVLGVKRKAGIKSGKT